MSDMTALKAAHRALLDEVAANGAKAKAANDELVSLKPQWLAAKKSDPSGAATIRKRMNHLRAIVCALRGRMIELQKARNVAVNEIVGAALEETAAPVLARLRRGLGPDATHEQRVAATKAADPADVQELIVEQEKLLDAVAVSLAEDRDEVDREAWRRKPTKT